MKYYDPNTIYCPKDFVTKVEIISKGTEDTVSIAKIIWDKKEHIGIRWNVARREWNDVNKCNDKKICVGMPSSHGHPVWFILPEGLIDITSKEFKDFIDKNENP